MTPKQIAVRLGVTPGRVRQLIAEKRLKAQRIGPVNVVHLRELERFICEERAKSPHKRGPKPKVLRKESPPVPEEEGAE